ncbi:hypothetical protein [Clostridium perfringens]|uniref:hypothetical protein n=1 Tax=Clostridium perfringens TaxID=1502 RepID=UPI0024BCC52D|nr:hypothetical protein [Clostridium perfringens]
MDKKILCTIRVSEVPLHLYQIIAGFMLLEKKGILSLKIENSLKKLPYNMMEVELDNKLKILYDVNDGYDNLNEASSDYISFYDSLLKSYDFCFKRSFSYEYNKKLKYRDKMKKLGLNYMVTIKKNLAHNIYNLDPKKEKIKKIIRKFPISQYYNNRYLIEKFEEKPKVNKRPKVLFIARLWDPNGIELKKMPKEKIDERNSINELRIKCIHACKERFGDQFIGGIVQSSYAKAVCDDLIINDKKITLRDNYLNLMKSCDICIATTGLHGSIGWKFAEYIAASKVIVSEKLNYELPGDFEKGKNYLEFNNVEECVKNIEELINNEKKRLDIMNNNYLYYNNYVKPDVLVLNTLKEIGVRVNL